MTHIWQGLRSGEWLTATRARGYSLILLGICTVAAVGWVMLSDGLTDPNGKPIGTDFSSFYAAGSMALEGHAANAYDMAAHYARQQQIFGASTPYYAWFYPPFLLFIAAPLALLPYPAALMIWQVATLAFYVCVIGAILQPIRQSRPDLGYLWVLLALAFPAVFINLGHGQNGLLTAALLGAALLMLTRQPLLSGTLFGLLAYKPQFALVIPIALLASNQLARDRRGGGNHYGAVCPERGHVRNGDLVCLCGLDRHVAKTSSAEWRRRLREIAKHVRRGAHVGRRASLGLYRPGCDFDRSRLRRRLDVARFQRFQHQGMPC